MQLVNWSELYRDEWVQLKEEGKDIRELERAMSEDRENRTDEERCLRLYAEIGRLPTRADYPYEEPSALEQIRRESDWNVPRRAFAGNDRQLYDKIYGGWLARAAGCLLGKPVEGWPADVIRDFLLDNGAYPLNNYFSNRFRMDKVPESLRYRYEPYPIEYCEAMPRDDDLDYTILALRMLETYGRDFTTDHVARMWLTVLPPLATYTAERAAYLNLCAGVGMADVPVFRNPYREWIGAQIRADFYGYVNPGDPAAAAEMAYRDAALSHVKNGIYGAMFVAAMNAAAFTEQSPENVVLAGMAHIPKRSRLHEAIAWTVEQWRQQSDWEQTGRRLLEKFGHYHWVHTINNAAVVAMALLYGEGDLERTISIAVTMGWDTDCNGATAGSVIGVMNGASGLPDKWIRPLHDRLESYISGEGYPRISQLALRTRNLIAQ